MFKKGSKKWSTFLVLAAILTISVFFRTYKIIDHFEYAHDGDLYSWVVKDIVVDKHPRLIGQLTSAEGIFIGPFYYYLLIPFFLIFNMDPIGAIVPITIISLLTTLSFFFVFSKLFNKYLGFFAAFLHAVLLTNIQFDRRVVPSTPTNLWVIWYFYVVISLAKGNLTVLPILGVLIGLIWHIHIALLPALIAIPVALLVSKKLPSLKQLSLFLISLAITSAPLLLFEIRHNFSQTQSLFSNFISNHGGGSGLDKLNLVMIKVSGNISNLFFYPHKPPFPNLILLMVILLLIGFFLFKKKVFELRQILVFYAWIGGVIFFYTLSSSPISEYYFYNIEVVFVAIVSGLFYFIYKSSSLGKYLIVALMVLIAIKNIYFFVTSDYYEKGYKERKAAAEFITTDAKSKGFPCVSVSYITSPGENVGFRYFFWLNNLHVNQPSSGSPVYTIVLPDELAEGQDEKIFGHIGVIPPDQFPSTEDIRKSCSGLNSNLTDSMFGYTQ